MKDRVAHRTAAGTASEGGTVDAMATITVVAVYMIFMLLVGFAPAFLNRTIFPHGRFSIGLILGIFVTVFLVLAAKTYTVRRNRQAPIGNSLGSVTDT